MKRRTFLQALLLAPPLALIRPKVAEAQQQEQDTPEYADSDGRTHAELAPLYDHDTQAGGVVYQP